MMLNIKQLLLYVGLLLCVLLQVCRSKTEAQCPSFCDCDLFDNRNRALCSAKRLISANIEMPKAVEILDLRYNDITTIDSGCFQNLVHLINLTISYNTIQTIHLDAFNGLRRLQALDLAYNRLEYIDGRLLEGNSQLTYLNLEGNKLMSLGKQPLLRSTSLRILNLRNSQINQLSEELISALPQLQQLDLSQNLLITLKSAAFNAPRQLRFLDLNENPLNCDSWLIKTINVLQKRGIEVSLSDCQLEDIEQRLNVEIASDKHMFERMQSLDSASSLNDTEKSGNSEHTSLMKIWRSLPDDSAELADEQRNLLDDNRVCDAEHEKLCLRYRSCLERVSHILLEQEDEIQNNIQEAHIYTEDDLKLSFAVGAATGICMVIFIITCTLCVKSVCEIKRKENNSEHEAEAPNPSVANLQTVLLVDNEAPTNRPISTPSRTRIPRRSNPSRHHQSHAVIRQPYGPQDSFLSRLFGRPARRQYYRTINQNTATLIRCLSRSNLFNNRLNQNLSTEQSTAETTANLYDSRRYEATQPILTTSSPPERPETPPPNYGDIVVIDNCDRK